MKSLFYLCSILFVLFEVANVYFIMPMPGSQEMNSIALAYFLHTNRWIFRILLLSGAFAGIRAAWKGKAGKWITGALVVMLGGGIYMTNFVMAADKMFLRPRELSMHTPADNSVEPERLVLGIEHNGQAKAYPIQYIGYHHQVRDSIGGKPVIVTYCTVCRSGRVYEPLVNGTHHEFRLVGMDHFNAMFEDRTTKSWWRQVTGEAVAGPLKGQVLPEWPSSQTSLSSWLQLHPNSLIMQPDSTFIEEYEDMDDFERGRTEGKLTIYDTASWNTKSWVAGIEVGDRSKAYDWNDLKKKQIIHDTLGLIPILLFVTDQNRSVFALERVDGAQQFALRGDTLWADSLAFDLLGRSLVPGVKDLNRINVYQEYWHSWKTFHPHTLQHPQ